MTKIPDFRSHTHPLEPPVGVSTPTGSGFCARDRANITKQIERDTKELRSASQYVHSNETLLVVFRGAWSAGLYFGMSEADALAFAWDMLRKEIGDLA